jgi:acyl-CoA hydrolase
LKAKTAQETSIIFTHIFLPEDANSRGNVHGGVIMKQIDNVAAIVASRHSRTYVVTASIDRLDFHKPAFIGELLMLKASLNQAGKTSMEVGVRAETENLRTGEIKHIASAYLTMISIDNDGKPVENPPLELVTDEDKRRNSEAMERRKVRIAERQNSK